MDDFILATSFEIYSTLLDGVQENLLGSIETLDKWEIDSWSWDNKKSRRTEFLNIFANKWQAFKDCWTIQKFQNKRICSKIFGGLLPNQAYVTAITMWRCHITKF